MTVAEAVVARLGGARVFRKTIRTERQLRSAVREGFSSRSLDFVLETFAEHAVPQRVVYGVVGNERTLQRKRSDKRPLSADESDRLARLARLLVRAEDVLGDEDKAITWLTTPNRALGGEPPVQLLDSDLGAVSVDQVLGRLEHGVFS